MRITGGIARSIRLKSPKGDFIRPSTDSSRERLFASLGTRVEHCVFLDLFAGTGACGLEALSRGASGGYFVELDRRAAKCIHENLRNVSKAIGSISTDCKVVQADALKWRPLGNIKFDIVFVDPPYPLIEKVGPVIFESLGNWIPMDGIVIFEMPAGQEYLPNGWEEFRRLGKRGKGDPTQRFLRPINRP